MSSSSSSDDLQKSWVSRYFGWLDADHNAKQGLEKREKAILAQVLTPLPKKTNISRLAPFAFLHLGCLGILWVGISPFAVYLTVALYFVRMFFITGFYHRYFSHRTFQTNRFWQFIFAICAMTSIQRGPLWWAANHRHHHKHSDEARDLHSPIRDGFWWSHLGWMTAEENLYTDYSLVPDLAKFPELVLLNRFDWIVPLSYSLFLIFLGITLEHFAPQLHTNGPQLLIWGLFVSTVFVFHFTQTINSLSHMWGSRRFDSSDTSRNNFFLALATMGEGWHNNHHQYQGTVRQGFYWWEIDVTYYVLVVMSWLGIVHHLNPVPARAYIEAETTKNRRLTEESIPSAAIKTSIKP